MVLGHVGTSRLVKTLSTFFYFPGLISKIEAYVAKCDSCQRNKHQTRGYGHLPARVDVSVPWEEIAVDSIGPWTIKVNGESHEFKALTTIDTVSTVCEIALVNNGTSTEAGRVFEQSWLFRYPRPE